MSVFKICPAIKGYTAISMVETENFDYNTNTTGKLVYVNQNSWVSTTARINVFFNTKIYIHINLHLLGCIQKSSIVTRIIFLLKNMQM